MDNSVLESKIENVDARLRFLNEQVGSFAECQKASADDLTKAVAEILEDKTRALESRLLTKHVTHTTVSSSGQGDGDGDVNGNNSASLLARIAELEASVARVEQERDDAREKFGKALISLEYSETQCSKHLEETINVYEEFNEMMREAYEDSQTRCRSLFEQLQDAKGSIRVMCRIRPPPPPAEGEEEEELVDFGPPESGAKGTHWSKLNLRNPRTNLQGQVVNEIKAFDFERVFGPEDTNKEVFEEINDLTQCAIEGQKVCVFTYGQTGSGKTYTMSFRGAETDDRCYDGLIPQTLAKMFGVANEQSGRYQYAIDMSVVEIYMNTVYDLLLDPVKGEKVSIRMEQASSRTLTSLEEAGEAITRASSNRAVSATTKNAESSRSHLIITFRVRREVVMEGKEKGKLTVGVLNLIDLAGSERSAQTGLTGQKLDEGIKINESLTNLNRVITALGQGTHIPFDTALTKALKPSLSADCKTLMLVMVNPYKKDLPVSLQSLEKGQEATKARLASMARSEKRPAAAGAATASSTSSSTPRPVSSGIPKPGGARDRTGSVTPSTKGSATPGARTGHVTPSTRTGGIPRAPSSAATHRPASGIPRGEPTRTLRR